MPSKDLLTLLFCIAIFGIGFVAVGARQDSLAAVKATPTPTITPFATTTPPGDPEMPNRTPTPVPSATPQVSPTVTPSPSPMMTATPPAGQLSE